jgi:hypothetical protein
MALTGQSAHLLLDATLLSWKPWCLCDARLPAIGPLSAFPLLLVIKVIGLIIQISILLLNWFEQASLKLVTLKRLPNHFVERTARL